MHHAHHALGSQHQTHSDSDQTSTLGDFGRDDVNEEDDGFKLGVAGDEGEDKGEDALGNYQVHAEFNEVLNIYGDGCLAHLQPGGQSGEVLLTMQPPLAATIPSAVPSTQLVKKVVL